MFENLITLLPICAEKIAFKCDGGAPSSCSFLVLLKQRFGELSLGSVSSLLELCELCIFFHQGKQPVTQRKPPTLTTAVLSLQKRVQEGASTDKPRPGKEFM